MSKKVLVLPGDYIGPEIMTEAVKVLQAVSEKFELDIELEYGLLGGAALDECGVPLPDETLARARAVASPVANRGHLDAQVGRGLEQPAICWYSLPCLDLHYVTWHL